MPTSAASIQPLAALKPIHQSIANARTTGSTISRAASVIVIVVEWMPAPASRRSSLDMSFTDFGRSLDQRASVGSRPDVSDSVSTTFADPAEGTRVSRRRRVGDCRESTANAANPASMATVTNTAPRATTSSMGIEVTANHSREALLSSRC